MKNLYNISQVRELERLVIAAGTTEFQLMQQAGFAAFNLLVQSWPKAKTISICCGTGNNAGDGLVVAKLAQDRGLAVTVYCVDQNKLKGSAKNALTEAMNSKVNIKSIDGLSFDNTDVIVDALLGVGLTGEIKPPFVALIEKINDSKKPVLALDVPSGIDVDTGCMQNVAVMASKTITFIGLKQGFFLKQAATYCGEITVSSLGIPESIFAKVKTNAQILQWERVQPLLPKRKRDSYKTEFGHVLVIGGDYGMGGAIRMAAEAAMRVGAGLVTVATRPEHVTVVSGSRPELMCHQVGNAKDLEKLMERATVIAIGPGLGQSPWSKELLEVVLESKLPKLLDADALNLLSENPQKQNNWILTPHPGEAGRLLNVSCQTIQADRFNSVCELQKKYGGVVVLKGVGTLVKGESAEIALCRAGNPGMASGGMGDVLSGVISGLLAQQLDLFSAASAGVLIHAMAADRAALEGGERGLLATDLLDHLREFVNPQ